MVTAALDYNRAIAILQGEDAAARATLAGDRRTPPEILFYLAEDPDIGVRRVVAENPSTPGKADALLSRDANISVRCAIARKIVGGGLDEKARRDMRRMGFTILETLMRDKVVRVRRILADAFRTDPKAPRRAVLGLARDRAKWVASPILRGSPVLTDADMVSIIEDGAPEWAQAAIARRDTVSPKVTEALVARGGTRAVAAMIANPRAQLAPPVLERLVDRAEQVPEWQKPLVSRPNMAGGLLVKLARFVAAPLLSVLCRRGDLDGETASSVNSVLEIRADEPGVRAVPARSAATAAAGRKARAAPRVTVEKPEWSESAADRARQLHETGALSDAAVALALDKRETGFVIEALALRAGLPADTVRRMVKVQSARTMVALSWKAGFGARFSMDLQRHLAAIPPTRMINAREGISYPMSETEMQEQLALFD